jgi:hypothetical protein
MHDCIGGWDKVDDGYDSLAEARGLLPSDLVPEGKVDDRTDRRSHQEADDLLPHWIPRFLAD